MWRKRGDEVEYYEKRTKRKAILIIFLILALCAAGIYISIVWNMHQGMVETVEEDELDEEDLLSDNVPIIQEEKKPNVFNVLLVGADARNPESENGRSDSMMLVSYNADENKATVASFMRDSLVEIPGHGQSKLGHSYAYGGVGLTVNTINSVYDLNIQNYVIINMENLKNVVDKLGGIEVTLTAAEVAYYQNFKHYFKEGVNHMNGEQALMHSRNRSLDNDFGRTRRQRDVMFAVYQKVMQTKDPAALLSIIKYCLTQVKTNMKIKAIYDMSMKIVGAESINIQQTSVPAVGTYTNGTYQGMTVLKVDIEANKKILEELLY